MHTMTYSRRTFTLAGTLACCGAGFAQQPKGDYRLAFVGPASPQVVSISPAMAAGIATAFDSANAQGGVHGRKLSLVHLDDGFVPEKSVELLAQAAEDPSLIGIAAVFATLATLKISSSGLLERSGLTVAAATTGARKPRELKDPHLLFFRPSYQDEISMIVRHAGTLGLSRFGFFFEDSGFGKDGVEAMQVALPASRAKMSVSYGYNKDDIDFAEVARKFAGSDAQAVVLFAVQNHATRFLKSLRRAGFRKPVFSVSVINADRLAADLGNEDARGVGIAQVVPSPTNPKVAVARQFQAALAQTGRTGYTGSQTALEGYIIGTLIVTGMKRAKGPLNREGFATAMRNLGTVDLGGMRAGLHAGMVATKPYLELGVIDGHGKLRN